MDDTFVIFSKSADFQAQVDKRWKQHLNDREPVERDEVERALWDALLAMIDELIEELATEADKDGLYNPHGIPSRYAELDAAKDVCERYTKLFNLQHHVIFNPVKHWPEKPYKVIGHDDWLEGLSADIEIRKLYPHLVYNESMLVFTVDPGVSNE